mmetsp:Transcript_64141/g.71851  ORF Transcript_64141/g.71851 Transcript_64141/m.71851 type:complete len:331 (-) Transcript_64141:131-1123(-)
MMKNNNATSPFCFDTARVAKVVDTTAAKVEKEAIAMTTGVAVIPVRPIALMNGIVLIVEITEVKVAREARRIMAPAKASTNTGQAIPGRRPTALTITIGTIAVEKVVDSMEVKVDSMAEREVKGARVEKVSGIPHTEQSEYLRISLLAGPHLILIISLLVGPHLIPNISLLVGPHLIPIIILLPTIMVVRIATIMRAGVITESIGRIVIILKRIICAIITMRDSISDENIVEKVVITAASIRNPVHPQGNLLVSLLVSLLVNLLVSLQGNQQESPVRNQHEIRRKHPRGNLHIILLHLLLNIIHHTTIAVHVRMIMSIVTITNTAKIVIG